MVLIAPKLGSVPCLESLLLISWWVNCHLLGTVWGDLLVFSGWRPGCLLLISWCFLDGLLVSLWFPDVSCLLEVSWWCLVIS